jgi:AraC-like DNA-binding protein
MSGRPPQRLMPGDVVLLPTNTPHALVSAVDGRTESLAQFEKDTRRTPDGDIVIQGPGAGTRVLCAAYDYDHEVAHPLMSQLPPVLYVPAGMPGDDGGLAATLRLLALELGGRPPGSRAAVGRLIDVMLIHVMRAWLRMQEDDATDGWLLALRDPVLARAMNAIHQRPGEPWTIESLAREVSVSRATLARRFAHLVGETPPEYLTRWRIDLAAQRLRDTDDTVGAIAATVGYRSEYSFSRAFTRHRGIAPGRYRRQARARALAAA